MTSAAEFPERYRLKAEELAKWKSEAMRLEKLSKRVFSSLVHHGEGAISAREHAARCDPKFTAIEDQWIGAQSAENTAEAQLDAMKIAWETWRSASANKRAEMKL